MWKGQQLIKEPKGCRNQKQWFLEEEKIFTSRKQYIASDLSLIRHQCLIDELKPLFGVPKTGTCWYRKGSSNKYYLLKRLVTDKVLHIDYNIELEDKLYTDVLEVMLFRWFFELPCKYSSLRLRYNPKANSSYAISYNDEEFMNTVQELPKKTKTKIIEKYQSLDNYFLSHFYS